MPALRNIRHEKFCQGIVSGLSQTRAYTSAGYSERGAKQSAARLLNNADVRSRVSELRQEIESSFVPLQITERDQRLLALQDRWDALRQAKIAIANQDYAAVMRTGVVSRRLKSIGSGSNAQVVEGYEINTALIESLNSVERRAAIETGQEVDRQDIQLGAKTNQRAELLAKAFTIEELEAMRARMLAVAEAEERGEVIDAPVAKTEERKQPAGAALAGPVEPGSAAPARKQQSPPAADRPKTGDAAAPVLPSVPKAPKSWRG